MQLPTAADNTAAIAAARRRYTPAYLESWRSCSDPLADRALAALAAAGDDLRGDLLAACRRRAAAGSADCRRFLDHVNQVPDWVDFEEFEAGQQLFRRNGVLTFLIGVSVLVSSYGGRRDNKVLALSGRLSAEHSFVRAVETAQFTLDVTSDDGLRRDNRGWQAIVTVRLLHALVRRYALADERYDVARYDEPINQEAMCGANMLFSHGVIRALQIVGVTVSDQEKESYNKLWRYAGYLMGVDEQLLPPTHAGQIALFDLHQYGYIPDEDTQRLYEGTVLGITHGARTLPLPLKLLGGGLLAYRPFIDSFIALTVNDTLRDYLGLQLNRRWRLLYATLRPLLTLLSTLQLRLPPLAHLSATLQGNLMQRIVKTLLK